MQKFWLLTLSFAIIGVGAYGGGIVTVPLIQRELAHNQQLLSSREISRIVAIAQMTPGPIAVNVATFAGYRVGSFPGAILATTVVVLPGVLILAAISYFRGDGEPNQHLVRIRRGLRAGVLSLLLFATWSYGQSVISAWPSLVLAIGAFAVLMTFEKYVHPLAVIGGCGVIGLLIF